MKGLQVGVKAETNVGKEKRTVSKKGLAESNLPESKEDQINSEQRNHRKTTNTLSSISTNSIPVASRVGTAEARKSRIAGC